MNEHEYIVIENTGKSTSGKTGTWRVFNKGSKDWLGRIVWYGRWRQYTFQPIPGPELVFSAGCLSDIAEFVELVTKIHKEMRKLATKDLA